jgi:hypothetical protein
VIPDSAFRSINGTWKKVDGHLEATGSKAKAVADVTRSDYTFGVDLHTVKAGKKAADVSRIHFHYQDDKNYDTVVARADGVAQLDKVQNGKSTPTLAPPATRASTRRRPTATRCGRPATPCTSPSTASR